MKIVMHGPLAGPDWNGQIASWGPGAVVEVDDSDERAVAWCKGWVAMGADLVEDVAKPKAETVKAVEPKKAAASSKP